MADSKLERLEELQQVWREMLVNHQVWRLRWNTMLEERRILLGTPLDSGERRQIEGHVMTLEVVVARHDENVKADIVGIQSLNREASLMVWCLMRRNKIIVLTT